MPIDSEGLTWLTKDNRRIAVRDMADAHIANAVAWSRRNIEEVMRVKAPDFRTRANKQRVLENLRRGVDVLEAEQRRRWGVCPSKNEPRCALCGGLERVFPMGAKACPKCDAVFIAERARTAARPVIVPNAVVSNALVDRAIEDLRDSLREKPDARISAVAEEIWGEWYSDDEEK